LKPLQHLLPLARLSLSLSLEFSSWSLSPSPRARAQPLVESPHRLLLCSDHTPGFQWRARPPCFLCPSSCARPPSSVIFFLAPHRAPASPPWSTPCAQPLPFLISLKLAMELPCRAPTPLPPAARPSSLATCAPAPASMAVCLAPSPSSRSSLASPRLPSAPCSIPLCRAPGLSSARLELPPTRAPTSHGCLLQLAFPLPASLLQRMFSLRPGPRPAPVPRAPARISSLPSSYARPPLCCRVQPCQLLGRRALSAFLCRALDGLCVAKIRSAVLRLDSNDVRKSFVAAVGGFSTKYLAKG
jgi:hypothetical protein